MKRFTDSLRTCRSWLRQAVISLIIVMIAAQLVTLPAAATSIAEVPRPAEGVWVIDKAEILSRFNESKISTQLADLATQTGYEVHFVTIRRLDYGETAQTFTEKLFAAWFPTPEAQAKQTLLVIDNLTNNTAIRTGDKIKATMSDAIAESVAQETLLVPLKQGNKYNQAFAGASDRVVAVLSGEPDPGPPQVEDNVMVEGTFATPEETKSSNATIWVIGFLIAATIIPMATYYFYQYMGSR